MTSNGWKKVVLKEVSYYGNEKVPSNEVTLDNYISTENMLLNKSGVDIASKLPTTKNVSRYNEGDILLSNIRPYFKKIWLADKSGGCSNDVLVIKNKNSSILNKTYLYYTLLQDNFFDYVTATSKGTKMPRGDKTAIMNYGILLPPLIEQKVIANIFSTLDEKIEANNQINKKLEEMAQTLFKHWFVDFEFPNDNGEPYKSSGGEMVDSELGMIPKGWEVSTLDKIADYLNGLAMQKYRPNEDEASLPVLKIKELRNGEPDANSDRCSVNIEEKYIINDGDIIFSWSGSLMVDIWSGGICGLNQHLFKVTSHKFNKWFYYFWIRNHLDNFINIANSKATTMGHIKRKDLSDAKVLIPNKDVYKKANEILDAIVNEIISLKMQSRKLKTIRDTLLPKLMSGEIRVPLDDGILKVEN